MYARPKQPFGTGSDAPPSAKFPDREVTIVTEQIEPVRKFGDGKTSAVRKPFEDQAHRAGKDKLIDKFEMFPRIPRELFLPFAQNSIAYHLFDALGKLRRAVVSEQNQAQLTVGHNRFKQLRKLIGMWTWFSPIANKVKQWLDDGEFGEIQTVVANYHLNSKGYAPRVTDPNRAGGALLDVGVYLIAYLYRLFGNPVKVHCSGVLENGIDLCEDVAMTFPNGKTYTASVSIVDYKGLEKMKIVGRDASTSIRFFHHANRAVLKRKHGKNEIVCGDGSMTNEFDRASEEIRNGLTESRFVPHQATLDVMRIMDECRRQMGLVYPFEKENQHV